MYAQLGDLFFDKQFAFTQLQLGEEARYAEHNLLNRKPKLEPTGLALREKTIGLYLRYDFCNVANVRTTLANYRDTFKALPLIWGTGEVDGVYVIMRIDTDVTQQLPDGTVYACNLTINLKEYIEDLKKEEEKKARQDAPAVDKQPVKRVVTNKPTCDTRVTNYWKTINANMGEIERLSNYSGYDGTYVICIGGDAMTNILRDLDAIEKAATAIYDETLTATSCLYNDMAVRQRSSDLRRKIPPFKEYVKARIQSTTNPLPEIQQYTINLRTYVDALKVTIDPYLNRKITKRG